MKLDDFYNLEFAFSGLQAIELLKKIKTLETRMYQHARNLEFEQAAALRDELQLFQAQLLES